MNKSSEGKGIKNFLIKLLGRLEYDKIQGKKKLDYFRDKYMEVKK
jgi:hypothetical protein